MERGRSWTPCPRFRRRCLDLFHSVRLGIDFVLPQDARGHKSDSLNLADQSLYRLVSPRFPPDLFSGNRAKPPPALVSITKVEAFWSNCALRMYNDLGKTTKWNHRTILASIDNPTDTTTTVGDVLDVYQHVKSAISSFSHPRSLGGPFASPCLVNGAPVSVATVTTDPKTSRVVSVVDADTFIALPFYLATPYPPELVMSPAQPPSWSVQNGGNPWIPYEGIFDMRAPMPHQVSTNVYRKLLSTYKKLLAKYDGR